MSSEVGICNVGLGRIGIDQFIEDFNDSNNRARACKTFYVPTRDQVLEDYPWNFAQKVAPLAIVAGDPPPGWQYQYAVPSDCARAQLLTDASGGRFSGLGFGDPYQQLNIWNYSAASCIRAPFKIMAAATAPGRIIVTDLQDAYLWYTMRVTDPNSFSALFSSSLSWKLAGELGLVLKADVALSKNAGQVYIAECSRAQLLSVSQSRQDDIPQSPSVMARR